MRRSWSDSVCAMPAYWRTMERLPSQPTTYWARTSSWAWPLRCRAVTLTPSVSASNWLTVQPYRVLTLETSATR